MIAKFLFPLDYVAHYSKTKARILFTLVVFTGAIAVVPVPIIAAESLDKAVAEYNRGDYVGAAATLTVRVKEEPGNATAYYYLGNCYLKQGLNIEANQAYSRCLQLNPQGKVADYALQALTELAKRGSAQMPAQPPLSAPQSAVATAPNAPVGPSPEAKRILDQAEVSVGEKKKTLEGSLARIEAETQAQIANIPKIVIPRRYTSGFYSYNRTDPEYAAAVAQVRLQSKEEMDKLQAEFERDIEQIRADAKRRAAGVDAYQQNRHSWSEQRKTGN